MTGFVIPSLLKSLRFGGYWEFGQPDQNGQELSKLHQSATWGGGGQSQSLLASVAGSCV
jgi:hypothetical protein